MGRSGKTKLALLLPGTFKTANSLGGTMIRSCRVVKTASPGTDLWQQNRKEIEKEKKEGKGKGTGGRKETWITYCELSNFSTSSPCDRPMQDPVTRKLALHTQKKVEGGSVCVSYHCIWGSAACLSALCPSPIGYCPFPFLVEVSIIVGYHERRWTACKHR